MIRKDNLRVPILVIMAAVVLSLALLLTACGGTESKQDSQVDRVGTEAEEYYAELEHCKEQIEEVTDFKPQVVLVLGSGMNGYAEKLDVIEEIPYEEIEGWPVSTVEGHISSFVPSPLIGENVEELGERFTPMDKVYDKEMRDTVLKVAEKNGITVHSGVFLQTTGPQYETPAEIRMYRELGADTVGMSSAVEAIAAAHKA